MACRAFERQPAMHGALIGIIGLTYSLGLSKPYHAIVRRDLCCVVMGENLLS